MEPEVDFAFNTPSTYTSIRVTFTLSLAEAATHTELRTLEPLVGEDICTVGGVTSGEVPPLLLTITTTALLVPTLPAASYALATRLWLAFDAVGVFQGEED